MKVRQVFAVLVDDLSFPRLAAPARVPKQGSMLARWHARLVRQPTRLPYPHTVLHSPSHRVTDVWHMQALKGREHGNRASVVRWGATGRETASADALATRLATAEGEKCCCATACVEVHGAPPCTADVFEVRTKRTAIAHSRPRTPVYPHWTATQIVGCV